MIQFLVLKQESLVMRSPIEVFSGVKRILKRMRMIDFLFFLLFSVSIAYLCTHRNSSIQLITALGTFYQIIKAAYTAKTALNSFIFVNNIAVILDIY